MALQPDEIKFVGEFVERNVCFRCILLMFGISDVQFYRLQDYNSIYEDLFSDLEKKPRITTDVLCTVCFGVLQHCDQGEILKQTVGLVKAQGFEFSDFKITFHISVLAILSKIRTITIAEAKLGI